MIPMQIAARDFSLTPAIRVLVKKHVAKLERFYDRIIHCNVTIAVPHRHHKKGNIYHITVQLEMPGGELVVSRESEEDFSHGKLQLALGDAFSSLERRMEARVRKMRGYVKGRSSRKLLRGKVKQVFAEQDYGLLESEDGEEIYFHRNSLKDAVLEKLSIGAELVFEVETGEKGPQASFVRKAKEEKRAGKARKVENRKSRAA